MGSEESEPLAPDVAGSTRDVGATHDRVGVDGQVEQGEVGLVEGQRHPVGLGDSGARRLGTGGDRRDGSDQTLASTFVETLHHGQQGVEVECRALAGLEGELEQPHGGLSASAAGRVERKLGR